MTDITVLSATAIGNGEVFRMVSEKNFMQIQNSASSAANPSSPYTDFVGTVRLQRSIDGSTNWNYTDVAASNITQTQCFDGLPTDQYFRLQVTAYTSGTILGTIQGGQIV